MCNFMSHPEVFFSRCERKQRRCSQVWCVVAGVERAKLTCYQMREKRLAGVVCGGWSGAQPRSSHHTPHLRSAEGAEQSK